MAGWLIIASLLPFVLLFAELLDLLGRDHRG
ncbi:membrane protein [Mycobacterium phage Zenteno07]|nr:membrane protein [Mycobacterium phage Zenteno07]